MRELGLLAAVALALVPRLVGLAEELVVAAEARVVALRLPVVRVERLKPSRRGAVDCRMHCRPRAQKKWTCAFFMGGESWVFPRSSVPPPEYFYMNTVL